MTTNKGGRPTLKPIAPELEADVVNAYLDGVSLERISKGYNVSLFHVKRVLKEHNVILRPRGRPPVIQAEQLDITSPLGETI